MNAMRVSKVSKYGYEVRLVVVGIVAGVILGILFERGLVAARERSLEAAYWAGYNAPTLAASVDPVAASANPAAPALATDCAAPAASASVAAAK